MDRPKRLKLPAQRDSVTHKFTIHSEQGPVEFYLIVGLFGDGTPGELFIKEGLHEVPLADQWARAASLLLQVGYTTKDLVHWFGFAKFEPCGYTDNEGLRMAHSVVDYCVRWMDQQYGGIYSK